MADSVNDLLSQAQAAEREDLQTAHDIVGSSETTREQNGYQQAIDQQRQQAQGADQPGLISRAVSAVARGGRDLVTHPVDDLTAAWNGVAQGVGQLAVSADELFSHIPGYSAGSRALEKLGLPSQAEFKKAINSGTGAIGSVDMTNVNKEDSAAGFVQGITQFLTGRVAITAATGGAGAIANVGSMVTAFNPDDKHVTDVLAQVPGLSEKYKAVLETRPGDPELENRFKSLLDGVTFEAGAKVAGAFVNWVRGARASTQLVEDAKAANDTTPTPVAKPAEATPAASPTADREAFLKEYNALPDHETQVGHKALGNTSVDISSDPVREDTVHLETIRANETGKGYGTAAMKQLTDMADKHGVRVTLDASPMGEGLTGEKLVDFYKQHGFTPSGEQGLAGTNMVREPPAPKPWVPESMQEQPKPGEAPAAVFNPNTIAKQLSVPVKTSQGVMRAINEGHYNVVSGMLDDTHRTIPWDQLSDGANLKGVFNAVEGEIGDLIKAHHGSAVVGDDAIRQLAADIGGDRQALGRLYSGVTQEGGLAARITAGYNMMTASARQLRDLAVNARDLDATTDKGAQAVLAFQKQLNLHAAIVGEVRQSSAEIGRALYAHRALKSSTDVALQNITDYAGTTLGPKALKNLAKQVANAKDLNGLTNVADQLRVKGWKGVLQEVAQNGMLSAPTTQVTNIVGNTSNVLLKMAERYIAGGIGDVRGVLFPSAQTASLREAVAHTQGAYEGLKVAAKLAWSAMQDENFTSKFSYPTSRAIDLKTTGSVAHTLQEGVMNAVRGNASFADFGYRQAINSLGTVIRWPGRFMGLFDHFSQGIGYHADLNARAYVQAAQEADQQGLQGKLRDAFLDQRMGEIKANPPKEIEQGAMAAGRYTAFLEPAQTKTGAAVMRMVNNMDPVAKLIIAPFIHRPGNFLRQALGDYTVGGLAMKSVRTQLASGGSDADLAMARMLLGTSAITGSTLLAANGGSVGQRLGNQNTDTLDGVPPYSVKIGNSWFKYDRLDPVGTWLAVGADLHEAFAHTYDPNDPDSTTALQKAASASVLAVSHATMDKTFLKSVQMITEAVSERDPAKAELLASRLVSENVAKLLPFSGLARSIAHGTDDVQRAGGKGSMFDGVVASIPYLSQQLPPRRDLLGRPMPAVSAWNPFFASTGNTDQMDEELSKVAMNINAPTRTIDGYTLNAHEYDEVVRNATQAKLFPGGTTIEGYLRDLTSSPLWKLNQSAPDGGQFRNGMMVQKALDSAYQYGRDQYKADHPDLEQAKQTEQQARFKASIAPLMQMQ